MGALFWFFVVAILFFAGACALAFCVITAFIRGRRFF